MINKYYIYFRPYTVKSLKRNYSLLIKDLLKEFNFDDIGCQSTYEDIISLIPINNKNKNTWGNFVKLILNATSLIYYKINIDKEVEDVSSLISDFAQDVLDKVDPNKNKSIIKKFDAYNKESASRYCYFFKINTFDLFNFIINLMEKYISILLKADIKIEIVQGKYYLFTEEEIPFSYNKKKGKIKNYYKYLNIYFDKINKHSISFKALYKVKLDINKFNIKHNLSYVLQETQTEIIFNSLLTSIAQEETHVFPIKESIDNFLKLFYMFDGELITFSDYFNEYLIGEEENKEINDFLSNLLPNFTNLKFLKEDMITVFLEDNFIKNIIVTLQKYIIKDMPYKKQYKGFLSLDKIYKHYEEYNYQTQFINLLSELLDIFFKDYIQKGLVFNLSGFIKCYGDYSDILINTMSDENKNKHGKYVITKSINKVDFNILTPICKKEYINFSKSTQLKLTFQNPIISPIISHTKDKIKSVCLLAEEYPLKEEDCWNINIIILNIIKEVYGNKKLDTNEIIKDMDKDNIKKLMLLLQKYNIIGKVDPKVKSLYNCDIAIEGIIYFYTKEFINITNNIYGQNLFMFLQVLSSIYGVTQNQYENKIVLFLHEKIRIAKNIGKENVVGGRNHILYKYENEPLLNKNTGVLWKKKVGFRSFALEFIKTTIIKISFYWFKQQSEIFKSMYKRSIPLWLEENNNYEIISGSNVYLNKSDIKKDINLYVDNVFERLDKISFVNNKLNKRVIKDVSTGFSGILLNKDILSKVVIKLGLEKYKQETFEDINRIIPQYLQQGVF